MNKMRQPLLFATGTFFAVMLAVFGTIDLLYVQQEQPFQTQSNQGNLPSTSAGANFCYRVTAPSLDKAQVISFTVEGDPLPVSFPMSMNDFIKAANNEGYAISYNPNYIVESKYSAIYINQADESIYTITRELPSGNKGSSKFVKIPCP